MQRCLNLITALLLLGQTVANPRYDEKKERYSSSTVGLLKLLELEMQFIENLKTYTELLSAKANTLQDFMDSVDRGKEKSVAEREKYVSNPLNAFGLMRRTHQDFPKWHNYINTTVGKEQLQSLDNLLAKAPDSQDMREALEGMKRIETIYGLQAYDLAKGRLQDKQYDIQLSIRDCLALGQHKYQEGDFFRASMWYRMAIKHELEPNAESFNAILGDPLKNLKRNYARATIIYGLSAGNQSQDTQQILDITEKAIHKSSPAELEALVAELLNQTDEDIAREISASEPWPTPYEIGCRGGFPPRTNLVCRYNSTTTPFLRLAPLKMEEVNHDPYIVMYHEVLSDREIEEMKRRSSQMSNGWADQKEANSTKIRDIVCRHSWWSEQSTIRERINRRITDMTGFDFAPTEDLQVANYGLGTHFKPHYDYTSDGYETPDVLTLGDRLGSIIFYASDVPQGGATVFPRNRVSILPRKGSSVFWFNLYDDGRPDIRSQHSVCPVIVGDRWTLTKWLHIVPQMFVMPCKPRKKSQGYKENI
ncbi:prolyl 4-hydroxylase subunit alpha-2 isoform X2 [Drosophila subobscura]|uniref:prolyl 4-hydroxylase subunit alpha-2 isoform X2 n=1 Tax=Drosophila subobscura TaxID=7241 RepID=UPI00155AF637|nr:prolyl 4-hydroxylase subunit alpha-2 isoform X2 [Drosophila subobscura]